MTEKDLIEKIFVENRKIENFIKNAIVKRKNKSKIAKFNQKVTTITKKLKSRKFF